MSRGIPRPRPRPKARGDGDGDGDEVSEARMFVSDADGVSVDGELVLTAVLLEAVETKDCTRDESEMTGWNVVSIGVLDEAIGVEDCTSDEPVTTGWVISSSVSFWIIPASSLAMLYTYSCKSGGRLENQPGVAVTVRNEPARATGLSGLGQSH